MPPPLPGSRWVAGLRSPILRVGVLTGVYLIAVMVISLLAANRVPWLESVAALRNVLSYAAFALMMLIPILYFRRSASQLFASAMVGWFLLSLAYAVLGWFFFNNLFAYRWSGTPFHLFILGAVGYGGVAVFVWVCSLLAAASQHPITPSRRRPY